MIFGALALFPSRWWAVKTTKIKTMTTKKRILFANIPAEGHFNPLTGLAVNLKERGHDVRWYSGKKHHKKLEQLGIPYFPFKKARDIDASQLNEIFPERARINGELGKLKFDIKHVFTLRSTEFYEDIKEINESFNFDLLICDIAFTGLALVRKVMNKAVFSIGIFPVMETSKDLPPYGIAMTPNYSAFGKLKQNVLKLVADNVLFKGPNKDFQDILSRYNIETKKSIFDVGYEMSNLVLQNGAPGFEYPRTDLGKNIRFMGPLFPASSGKKTLQSKLSTENLKRYKKVILVTQGTVERDVNKLLVPSIEAFKDSNYFLVVTTGGSQTNELRDKYASQNIHIADFIPFDEIMPLCDVYISNGGFGGVMYGIMNKLPMVVAGVHEGKNEINARIGYLKYGINLKTETPTPQQLSEAVEQIINDNQYKRNVVRLANEFAQYDAGALCEQYIGEVLADR